MDMEIALSFVVLAVMDCPVSTHSLVNKIPLQVRNSIHWGVTLSAFLQAVRPAFSLPVQQRSIKRLGLPVILADKNAPTDVRSLFNCRLPLTPPDYGETCACLFRDISHTQHLHSADRAEGHTHRLCGQIKAALWLLSERKVH